MTNTELTVVSILGTATLIYLTLLYYFYVIKPVNDEQKEGIEETKGTKHIGKTGSDTLEVKEEQLN